MEDSRSGALHGDTEGHAGAGQLTDYVVEGGAEEDMSRRQMLQYQDRVDTGKNKPTEGAGKVHVGRSEVSVLEVHVVARENEYGGSAQKP